MTPKAEARIEVPQDSNFIEPRRHWITIARFLLSTDFNADSIDSVMPSLAILTKCENPVIILSNEFLYAFLDFLITSEAVNKNTCIKQ